MAKKSSPFTSHTSSFLHRLQGDIAKCGVADVLRGGIKHGPAHVDLFYGTPTPGNAKAAERFAANIFSVTRQLRYSRNETAFSLDTAVFINGLPIATFELQNKLTKQTVLDAVQQYQRDREPKELLFQFGRCVVHFAVDDHEVRFCTHLKGKGLRFLPFNKGYNDDAGNPPNSAGLATGYLWKETLSKAGLTDILENYAQVVEEKDEKTGKKRYKQVFPRYHQLKVVRMLLADAAESGIGRRYLIQHSAGSGKSNSIAWLAHQLVGLEHESKALFDSVIVVTDRRVLDKQICDTIKQFAQVSATVGHAEHSDDLRKFLKAGKKIIITTVQKFPFILDEIGDEHRKSKFATIIGEAHSSQGGKTTVAMNRVLEETVPYGGPDDGGEETVEDKINKIMEGRNFDTNKAQKKLRCYVESHEHAIREKTEIMVDHFHAQVIGHRKIGDHARTIQYFHAFKDYLKERKSPYAPIVAFSGEHEYGGRKVTEATLNGFPSSQIPDNVQQDPYRFLIVADKYQIGYDEPLLHTMYVDKALSGVKAVQTLSRLNHAHPQKHDTFVVDFYSDSETIQKSFEPYYRTTILSDETDPNKLHDLKSDLDSYRVEVKTSLKIGLPDQDAEIGPVPTSGGGRKPEPELVQLSNIIKTFNDQFGNIAWKDGDKIRKVIAEEIPAKVGGDVAYQNAMKNNDKKTARIEHDAALQRVMIEPLADHTELFKQSSDNPSFKRWLGDTIFGVTYQQQSEQSATGARHGR